MRQIIEPGGYIDDRTTGYRLNQKGIVFNS